MKEAEFQRVLKSVFKQLEKFLSGELNAVKLPAIDRSKLDLAQEEVWKRLKLFVAKGEYFDPECEACREGYELDIQLSAETIQKYLNGKLTSPQKVGYVTYDKKDKSHGVTTGILLDGEAPKVLNITSHLAKALQKELRKKKYKNIEDIKVPQQLLDYKARREDLDIKVMFAEEISNNLRF